VTYNTFPCLFKPLTRGAGCFVDRHPHTTLEVWDILMGHPVKLHSDHAGKYLGCFRMITGSNLGQNNSYPDDTEIALSNNLFRCQTTSVVRHELLYKLWFLHNLFNNAFKYLDHVSQPVCRKLPACAPRGFKERNDYTLYALKTTAFA
jgi:hypothetical protein